MATDEELMEATARGDREAFGELVRRHHASAFRLAARFLGDRQEAADITQEAFLRVLDAAPRYRAAAAFTTYLYRVVGNLCTDHRRKARPETGGELPDRPSEAPSALEGLAGAQRDEAVRAALAALPSRQRLAVLLKYYEGLGYKELAEALETSEKGAERLLSRAREELLHRLPR